MRKSAMERDAVRQRSGGTVIAAESQRSIALSAFCRASSTATSQTGFDPSYWWPKSAGYDRAIARSTYPPIASWKLMGEALQRTGMTADEAALVLGGNMVRVARQVWG